MGSGRPDYRHGHDLEAQSVDRISTITKAPTGTTKIFKSARIENGTTLLRQVPAGKTLYLTAVTMGSFSIDTAGESKVTVRDDLNADQYNILWAFPKAATGSPANITSSITITPPLEIPEGWDVVVVSDDANVTTTVSMSGWEE